jgi:hypothetical protein
MQTGNPFNLLKKLEAKPLSIPVNQIKGKLSKEDIEILTHLGLTLSELSKKVELETTINYDRSRFYNEVTRAIEHWFVGPAMGLYADYATAFNTLHNASVWITSKSPKYQKELTKLLERIGIEEKILDWAWTTGGYGDLFIEVKGQPGIGVYSINDDEHPLNISRIDHEGCLIGFYRTPQGQSNSNPQAIIPPWEWVHCRLLGAKRKRPMFSDPLYAEFRTMHMMTGVDTKQVSSRYGTSLLIDSLATYKRLRLAEDSLLMARLTRGILRYVWKLKINSQNAEATAILMDQLVGLLKKARALDTSMGSPNFDSKFNTLAVNEDIVLPVFGDSTDDLSCDKIGGEVDIRWIIDVEELKQQLSCTLRVPLALLGSNVDKATGGFSGGEVIEQLDIGFARSARRLQRSLRQAIKRICQIHLAYMNMDPDPALFDVCMNDGSTKEEDTTREALDKGLDCVQKFLDVLDAADPDKLVPRAEALDYLNKKILKMEDFDLSKYLRLGQPITEAKIEEVKEDPDIEEARLIMQRGIENTDLMSFLPLNENSGGKFFDERHINHWKTLYGEARIGKEEDFKKETEDHEEAREELVVVGEE